MADLVVVMRAGRIEQQSHPLDLYDRPANRFVAGFAGSPAMTILPATVEPCGLAARINGADGVGLTLQTALEPGAACCLACARSICVLARTDRPKAPPS